MKKLLIIILLAVGAVQAASIIVPKLKPAKEEFMTEVEVKREILPEVIINGTSSGKGYSTNFTVELAQFCPKADPNYKTAAERFDYQTNDDGTTVFVKHCHKCNVGIYSLHNGETIKTCTYCGDKEQKEEAGE
jgi:hypothetical protein